MRSIITIHGDADRKTRYGIAVFWIFMLVVVWMFNPITSLPTPLEVYNAFFVLLYAEGSTSLLYNIFVTLKLQIFGIFYATLISASFAYLGRMAVFHPLNKFIQLLRYIPIVGFTIVFYSLFTIGFGMKVAMLTAGLTFFLTTSMTAVMDEIPRLKYELAKSLGYNDWQIFWTVVFFPSLPAMIEVIVQNAAMGWLMIVAVETFNRTEGGMGAMLQIYSASNQVSFVYVYLIIIGVIAVVQDFTLRQLKGLLFPYTKIAERA
jgi:NitT/TauT family transport system permease protein